MNPMYKSLIMIFMFVVINNSSYAFVLSNSQWQIDINPETLATEAKLPEGKLITVSIGNNPKIISKLKHSANSASWQFNSDINIEAKLNDNILTLKFIKNTIGKIVWPYIPQQAKALIIPIKEGYRIPSNDKFWTQALVEEYSGMNTTEGLSLPVLGLEFEKNVLSVIFVNPFNNKLEFKEDTKGIAIKTTHSFTNLDTGRPYEVRIILNKNDKLAPAKEYRKMLQSKGEFVSLKDKLSAVKNGEFLIGATHIYLWGKRIITQQDVKDWKILQKEIPKDWLEKDNKDALTDPNITANKWFQQVLINAIDTTLIKFAPGYERDQIKKRKEIAIKIFMNSLNHPDTWGDSNSAKMITRLKHSGVQKLWLGFPHWTAGFYSPEGIKLAKEAGYLIAPYDSYNTALPEKNSNHGWLSAQLGQDAFVNCGIMLQDGKRKKGFQGQGVYTNPKCVRNLMENRITKIQRISQYNSWFLDVDGTGMVFDDYDPLKPTSQFEDAKNRIKAMSWIAKSQGIIVGSEDGGAIVNSSIAFAHGMQTSGFGWTDHDMRKNRKSQYFLGIWYPDYQPAFFFKSSSIKPKYQALFFDPRKRLPLFQAAFHDSLITTHHWTIDNLKFIETRITNELLQQLYNVPPLLNLSLDTSHKRIPYLKHLAEFFRPLHARLYDKALVNFHWLTEDGKVQETEFSDGTLIIANFNAKKINIKGKTLSGHSVMAIFPDGQIMEFHSKAFNKN